MDDLIRDAQLKHLISFGTRPRFMKLYFIYRNTKNMAKLPQLELGIYWLDYIQSHGDYCGFINDEEN